MMPLPSSLPLLALLLASPTTAQQPDDPGRPRPGEIGFWARESWMADLERDVRSGRIPDPRTKLADPGRYAALGSRASSGCFDSSHLFLFEDTNQVLLSSFSNGELFDLMTDAANAVVAQEGDQYDFIGYWIDFTADHEIGAAFYLQIFNDVEGIGSGVFDSRAALGLTSGKVQGWIMMWDVNHSYWAPGTDASADFTRLALAQEFEHRFAMFLPDTLDGRQLQGDNAGCGRGAHWNFKVDGQGSGMEIGEWVGTNPANLSGTLRFNTDTGGVFSYPDLYLMGMVTPAEMDAGMAEFRYLETSDCSSPYNGTISPLSSADIIASAGPRIPDAAASQKLFRTAWVMIHLPGQPPSQAELDKATAILDQHMIDWNEGTLRRSVMDDTLFDACPEQLVYGSGINPPGSIQVTGSPAKLGNTLTFELDNPLASQTSGSTVPVLLLAMSPHPNFPAGVLAPNLGMAGAGELLLDLSTRLRPNLVGATWSGSAVPIDLQVPTDIRLVEFQLAVQGILVDLVGSNRYGLTDAVRITIGP